MTSKTATKNLTVSLLRLLTGLVDLVTKTVTLGIALLTWGIRAVERQTAKPLPAPAPKPSVIARAPVAIVGGHTEQETLHNALVALGFRAPEVRRFVSSVGSERAAQEPMADLIKEGLRALAS